MHTSYDYTSKLGFVCEVVRVRAFKCDTDGIRKWLFVRIYT